MARPALSQEELARTREEICEVATRLFADQGYAGVTIRAIAAKVGCSPMTTYRYFADKEAIFTAIRAAAFARFAAAQEVVTSRERDPEACLQGLGEVYVRFALEDPAAYRIMFELDQMPECEDPDQLHAEHSAWTVMRDAVARAVDAGFVSGDPDTVAHLYWGGLHGLVSLHLAGKLRLGRELPELTAAMLRALLDGTRAHERPRGDLQ